MGMANKNYVETVKGLMTLELKKIKSATFIINNLEVFSVSSIEVASECKIKARAKYDAYAITLELYSKLHI